MAKLVLVQESGIQIFVMVVCAMSLQWGMTIRNGQLDICC